MARNRHQSAPDFPAADQRKGSDGQSETREPMTIGSQDVQQVSAAELVGETTERPKANPGKYGEKADTLPDRFKYTSTRLFPRLKPKGRDTSVWNRIFSIIYSNPGITGAELAQKMVQDNWNNPTKYADGGVVCLAWAAGYINGAMRERHAVLTTSYDVFKDLHGELSRHVPEKPPILVTQEVQAEAA